MFARSLPWARARPSFRWSAAGSPDLFFSFKTLIAALLAWFIALHIQLERPYWAVITCYIVAQPLTSALVSKGIFRLLGTMIGAAVAVAIVPNLVDAPELLVAALTLWLGLCTYVAALDRTPRSYVSLLAGYSAIIVAVPTVDATETIFQVAISRVQEIGIGIVCVSLVHSLAFPRPVWRQVRDRVDAILRDAWPVDALAVPPAPEAVLWHDRQKLADDLHDLHQLSTHLPYDMASPAGASARLREAELQLGLLLPLASAVENRIAALDWTGDDRLHALIADVRDWIAGGRHDAAVLTARAAALEPALDRPLAWQDLVRLSLLDRLASLIAAHHAARSARDRLLDPAPAADVTRRALHRDHRVALHAAVTTMLTVIAAFSLWIATAWPEGGTAVVSAAIICALFSHLDTPLRAARRVLFGTLGAAAAAGVCAFGVLPHVTDFVTLCLTIAPFLLALGWLMAKPERVPFGVGAVLAFPGLAGLGIAYDSTLDGFANQAAAQVVGSFIACLMLGAVRATGSGQAAQRLARAGWRELAARTDPRSPPETSAWISRMLDRMVLLGPHLSALIDADALTQDRLRDIRIGMALDDWQRAGAGRTRRGAVLNARLRAHFLAAQASGALTTDARLSRAIERALDSANRLPPSPAKRSQLLALVGLARNLV